MTPYDKYCKLDSLVHPRGGIEFSGDVFRRLSGPVVYLFSKEGDPWYVGRSSNGINRVSDPRHHRMGGNLLYDTVQVWPCVSEAAAIELEEMLIEDLKPILNQRGKRTGVRRRIAARLGLSRSRMCTIDATITKKA